MGKFSNIIGFTACRLAGGPSPPPGVPVLTFHAVENSGTYLSTAIIHFRAAMERLAERGVTGLTISELARRIKDGQAPERAVALTFDDGLTSFGEHAWPILRSLGHRATLYVPVDYVGGVTTWYKDYGLAPMPTHTWDELRELRDEGVDIQSHGCRHPKLTTLDAEGLREEMHRSRATLERELGVTVEHFCYPFGDHNAAVVQAAHACGYRSAVTTRPGRWQPGAHPLAIPRDCLDMINLYDATFSGRVIDACLDGSFSRYIRLRDQLKAMVGMRWEPPREP